MDCLRKVEEYHVSGIVLDLLDNGGGLTDAVAPIASCFLDEGDLVYSMDDHSTPTVFTASRTDLHTDLPVVILANENTASAAEILLCSLKENGRAVTAGQTTYGKGTWNTYAEIDGAVLYLTIGEWYTPNGNNITGKGVTPDYVIPYDVDPFEWGINYLTGTN